MAQTQSTRQMFSAVDAQVASAAAAVVSAATGETVAIDHALLHNTTGSTVTVTVHRDATAGTPADANIVTTVAVGANATVAVSDLVNLTLNAGESLFMSDGTGAQVNHHISGRVLT